MSIFHELTQQLRQQLPAHATQSGLIQLTAEVRHPPEVPLLARLAGFNRFPHCFWQSRDGHTSEIAMGAVREFDRLDTAQSFSDQYGVTLLGGVQFEGRCRLILPRLRLVKTPEKLTACLSFEGQSLAEQQQCLALLEQLATPFSPLAEGSYTPVSVEAVQNFARWQHNVAQALQHIQQQHFHKVVLANATTFHFAEPLSAYALLERSRQQNTGCYHFLWAESAEQIFMGSSPERLYRRCDRQLQTEALAGTVAVTADVAQTEQNADWLLRDQKNLEENQFVVDDIQQHLAECVSELHVGPATIKRLKNVQHLRRQIHATLYPHVRDADCLARIQPTAAVAGLPRQAAQRFIAEQEGFERGWYAGALGYFNPQEAEFCVTLRSAWVAPQRMTLYAGAGIVAGSTAEAEWQEIERKSLAMANLFHA